MLRFLVLKMIQFSTLRAVAFQFRNKIDIFGTLRGVVKSKISHYEVLYKITEYNF